MTKELQTLSKIKNTSLIHENSILGTRHEIFLSEGLKEEFNIIEKGLKREEQERYLIAEICKYVGLDDLFPYDNLKLIEKTLKAYIDQNISTRVENILNSKKVKAFDIIESKNVDLPELRFSYSVEEYNTCKRNDSDNLTKEEYDVVKKVIRQWKKN